MTRLAIGVDVGGTRTKTGLVNLETGQVLFTVVQPTQKHSESEFLMQLETAIGELRAFSGEYAAAVSGIGFGVSSFVNENCIVDSTYGFLPFMEDYPLADIVQQRFGLACRIDNDARVVALGEARYGKGKEFSRVLVLTLGTGLGVGFVKNGKFDDRVPFGHMAGHITITNNDHVCYCGKTGCLESLVSSAGINFLTEKLGWVKKHPGLSSDVETIFDAAGKGNTDAKEIVNTFIGYLHTGIHNYINFFAPDCIVIGGGIGKAMAPYIDRLKESKYLRPFKNYQVQVFTSDLHENAGICGSAALVEFNEGML
jgi:glucokinase